MPDWVAGVGPEGSRRGWLLCPSAPLGPGLLSGLSGSRASRPPGLQVATRSLWPRERFLAMTLCVPGGWCLWRARPTRVPSCLRPAPGSRPCTLSHFPGLPCSQGTWLAVFLGVSQQAGTSPGLPALTVRPVVPSAARILRVRESCGAPLRVPAWCSGEPTAALGGCCWLRGQVAGGKGWQA